METTRRIHDHRVEAQVGRLRDRSFCARDRIHDAGRIVHADARFLRDDVELLDRGGPFDVGRHEQRMLALLCQPHRELSRGRRFPGALQAEHQDDARPLRRRLQPAGGVAEERHHLVADDPHHLLRRIEAAQHGVLRAARRRNRVHRPIPHAIDERLDDLEVDVGFEERQADLAQRRLDAFRRQPRLAPERLEDALKPIAQ